MRTIDPQLSPLALVAAPAETPSAALTALSLAGARRLAPESPLFEQTPLLVLARRLALLVEAVLKIADSPPERPPEEVLEPVASHWLAWELQPADLLLALLEVEWILEELMAEESGEGAVEHERMQAHRKALRAVVRFLRELVAPTAVERQRRRLVDVLEALPEAILLVDEDERVSYANGRVREAYGVEPASIVGRSLADVLTEPDVLLRLEEADSFLDATLRLLQTRGEQHEDIFRQLDGSAFVRRSLPVGDDGRLVLTTNVTRVRLRNLALEQVLTDLAERPPSPPIAEAGRGARRLTLIPGGCAD